MVAQHNQKVEEMKKMAEQPIPVQEGALQWLKDQLSKLGEGEHTDQESAEKARKEQEEKNRKIAEIKTQQEELAQKLQELTGENPSHSGGSGAGPEQGLLLQQLHAALSTKGESDPQKAHDPCTNNTRQQDYRARGSQHAEARHTGQTAGCRRGTQTGHEHMAGKLQQRG